MLYLEVITPQGSVLSVPVDEVTAPGIEGEFQVLPSHLPALSILGGGRLSYTSKGKEGSLFLRGGVIEVTQGEEDPAEGRVLVLAEETQLPDQLDAKRAETLRAAAERELSSGEYLSESRYNRVRQDLGFAEAVLNA